MRESQPEFLTLTQVAQVEKRARVAATYAKQLERKRIGENCHSIAAEIGRVEGIGARTVRRWASEIERRGDALRKPGSGRPEKYNKW